LLCELPAPHGALMVWLEAQLHEHGPLQWSALKTELQGQAVESLALRLMDGSEIPPQTPDDAVEELRDLLGRMLMDHLKEQETLAIAAVKLDPQALERYRTLRDRRLQLLKIQTEGIIPS
jgi:DNA primase